MKVTGKSSPRALTKLHMITACELCGCALLGITEASFLMLVSAHPSDFQGESLSDGHLKYTLYSVHVRAMEGEEFYFI